MFRDSATHPPIAFLSLRPSLAAKEAVCASLGKNHREGKAIRLPSGDMAEEKVNLNSLLNRAKEQEKAYCWLGAADVYRGALELLPKDNSARRGQIQEERAYALFRTTMQAENIEEFKERLSETAAQYEEAKKSYSEASSHASSPRVGRCDAMIAYLCFWQATEVTAKKKKVSEAWSLAKKAMDAFGQNEILELGKTYNELFLSSVFSLHFSDDQKVRTTILSEAIEYGEKVVGLLSDTENRDVLVKALLNLAGLLSAETTMSVISIDKRAINSQKTMEHMRRAMELSEETALVSDAFAGLVGDTLLMDVEGELQVIERQLEFVRKTRDRLAIGVTLGLLASCSIWLAGGEEDPKDVNVMLDKSLQYVEEARGQFGRIGFVTPDHDSNIWVSSPSLPWYFDGQARFETDLRRKRELYAEALKSARLESVAAEKSGYPGVVAGAHFLIGLALAGLAKTEASKEHRARLLEEAIQHRIEASRLVDLLMPSNTWDRAHFLCLVGETELELAEVTDRSETKKAYLDSSISHLRKGVDMFEFRLTVPHIAALQDATAYSGMSYHWRQYGRALRSSCELTGARETMVNSAMAFVRAAEIAGKTGLPSRVAESLWEAAQTYDGLGEHLKASEKFDEASDQYRNASDKTKTLGQFYKDLCLYLKAWSEIEKARYHHARQEPASAKEHYDRAAELHESTGKWSFLSSNYFAWAQIENAEDLSQRERCKESIDAFREASRLFKDSKSKMQAQHAKIEVNDEKQMVERLIGAADQREEFCKARIILEEARLLDKEGSLSGASEKYGLAAEMFAKIKQELAAEQDQREIELIVTLSRAWRAMAKAESGSSPELYEEAAHLFDDAKSLGLGDKARNLAMGHSRLCMALGAGARYADNGDIALHEAAVQNLESAARYYLKADLQSAAEYAKASKLLFDGYVYMNKASSEENQEKRTKLYSLAEKVLQASSSSYEKAGQRGRREQVLKLLAKVKDDRELAMSLAEVFLAPEVVSTTMAFSSPTPTNESAVGLERFEHADVQAILVVQQRDILVGENLDYEIELVNAGREAAQLTKLEEVIPRGFDMVSIPERYRREDGCINLKGRKLDALKTEVVKIVVKPTIKGRFTLKPRITYLDETGSYKSSEPKPVEVTVKEMGISGWLRGT